MAPSPSLALCLAMALLLPAAAALEVTAHRPAAATWKRTQCGSPSGKHGPIRELYLHW